MHIFGRKKEWFFISKKSGNKVMSEQKDASLDYLKGVPKN